MIVMGSYNAFIRFFFELGMLKSIQRTGWSLIGCKQSESVADHSLRAAQIGYFLACLEGYNNPEQIATMLVFHDIGECRTGDIHKVANKYVVSDEKKAVTDQLTSLGNSGDGILTYWEEIESLSTPAGRIAKDADLLEMAVTAIEIMKQTGIDTSDWIDNTEKRLNTTSAKEIINQLKTSDSSFWWKDLKEI
jgi:putative hydrolases of HD superfamily